MLAVCVVAALLSGCGSSDEANVPQLLARASEEAGYLNFRTAREMFSEALAATEPGSDEHAAALFGKATCAQQIIPPSKSDIAEAASLFEQLLEAHPDSIFAPRALMNLGRIAHIRDYRGDEPDPVAARKWYEQVIEQYRDDPIAGEATLRLASTYIQTVQEQDVRKGFAMLEGYLAAHPDHYLASVMWQYLGEQYMSHEINEVTPRPWHDNRKALQCWINADRTGLPQKGREGSTYWRIAVLAQLAWQADRENAADGAQKFKDVAVAYYRKVITRTPNSGKAYRAWLRLQHDLGQQVEPFKKMIDISARADAPEAEAVPEGGAS